MDKEIQVIEQKIDPMVEQAKDIVINSNPKYLSATDFLKGVKSLQKEVLSTFNPIVEKANQTHKEALMQKQRHLNPLLAAEKLVKSKISAFVTEKEWLERAEREKEQKEAEKRRLKLEEKAEKAYKAGNDGRAVDLLEEAAVTIAPEVKSKIADVKGVTIREDWYAEVVDFGVLPRAYAMPDMQKLNKFAKAMKNTVAIPGVVFRSKKIIGSTSR